jgi:hypothetical protein
MTIIEILEIVESSIDESLKQQVTNLIKELEENNLNKDISNNYLWIKILNKIESKKLSEKRIYY